MVAISADAVGAVGAGAVVLAFGYLIRFRGWTFLVAGYDESEPIPDNVVADTVGSTLLRVGLATVALGVAEAVMEPPGYLWLAFAVVVLLDVGRLLYRLSTYPPGSAA